MGEAYSAIRVGGVLTSATPTVPPAGYIKLCIQNTNIVNMYSIDIWYMHDPMLYGCSLEFQFSNYSIHNNFKSQYYPLLLFTGHASFYKESLVNKTVLLFS